MTIDELAEQAGVPVRTVRFYLAAGLLPRPGGRGRATVYGEEHLLRLRLIRKLSERRVPLAEQRARLGALSLDDVRELLKDEEERLAALAEASKRQSPREYVAALLRQARQVRQGARSPMPWDAGAMAVAVPSASPMEASALSPAAGESWLRFQVAPGIELHVREEVWRRDPRSVESWLDLVGRLARGAGRSPLDT